MKLKIADEKKNFNFEMEISSEQGMKILMDLLSGKEPIIYNKFQKEEPVFVERLKTSSKKKHNIMMDLIKNAMEKHKHYKVSDILKEYGRIVNIKHPCSAYNYQLVFDFAKRIGCQTGSDKGQHIIYKGELKKPIVRQRILKGRKRDKLIMDFVKSEMEKHHKITLKKMVFNFARQMGLKCNPSGKDYDKFKFLGKKMGYIVEKDYSVKYNPYVIKRPEEKKKRVYMAYGYIYRKIMDNFQDLPNQFTIREIWNKISNVPFDYTFRDKKFKLDYNNCYNALRKMVEDGRFSVKKIISKGGGGHVNIYEKVIGRKPVEEKLDIPLVSEDVLKKIFEEYHDGEFTAKGLIGFRMKNGEQIGDREANFLFRWICDNMVLVSKLINKEIKISGFGLWKKLHVG